MWEDKIYSFEEAFNANTESVISSGELLINLTLYELTLENVIGKSSPATLLHLAAESIYKADLAVSPVEFLIVRYNSPCPNEEPFHHNS